MGLQSCFIVRLGQAYEEPKEWFSSNYEISHNSGKQWFCLVGTE